MVSFLLLEALSTMPEPPPPLLLPALSSPPQAAALSARVNAPIAAATLMIRIFTLLEINLLMWTARCPALSVREDLGEEVLGPVTLGVGEELGGRCLFDELAVGHEDHAVGRVPGEAHLVRDHDHGHAL